MNKIFFLKIVIGVLTFLIFLTLGGIIYGLVNYKTTPKLFRKIAEKKQTALVQTESPKNKGKLNEATLDLQKGEEIEKVFACGEMLCVYVQNSFDKERIIVVHPSNLKKQSVLNIGIEE